VARRKCPIHIPHQLIMTALFITIIFLFGVVPCLEDVSRGIVFYTFQFFLQLYNFLYDTLYFRIYGYVCLNIMSPLWAETVVHYRCRNNYKSSLDLLVFGTAGSGFNAQYRKWRRDPVAAPATVAAETRAPSGAVSVPLPRTPNENILSKTWSWRC
jgi:hypothetical protein